MAFRKGGGTSLGVRITPGGHATTIASSWRVRGVPRAWSGADVVAALNGADCSETEITSEAYGKRPWLVRTKVKDDDGALALIIEAGTHRLQLERVQRRHRADQANDTAWRPPKGKGKGKSKAQEGAPFRTAVCIDDDEEALAVMEVDSGDGAPSGRDGSPADPVNTNSEAQAAGAGKDAPQGAKRPLSPGARGRATKDTWTEEDCGGEGHCFYNCVSAGFIIKTKCTNRVQKTLLDPPKLPQKNQPNLVDFSDEFWEPICSVKASRRQEQEHKPGPNNAPGRPNCRRKINQIKMIFRTSFGNRFEA